ncbi:MAG: hypothetical protein ABEH88_10135 [Halobacteriales archaeon]
MNLQDRADDAYDWFAALSLSVRIWIITLVGGLLSIPLTQGVSIGLFLAGIFTGLIARLMYD